MVRAAAQSDKQGSRTVQSSTQALYSTRHWLRQALRAAAAASIVEHEYVCPQQLTVPLELVQVPLAVVHCSVLPAEQVVLQVWAASAMRTGSTLKTTVSAIKATARERAFFIPSSFSLETDWSTTTIRQWGSEREEEQRKSGKFTDHATAPFQRVLKRHPLSSS